MRDDEPDRRWSRTPRQVAADRLTSTLFILLVLVLMGVVFRLGPAEAMGRIASAF